MEYVKCFDEHEEYQNYKDGPFYVGPNVSMCMDMIHTHISGEQEETNYLTFTALENSTIRFNISYDIVIESLANTIQFNNFLNSVDIEYATNNTKVWESYFATEWTVDTEDTHICHGKEITLQKGDIVKFRGQNDRLANDSGSIYFFFSMTGSIDASGDVTSLNNRIGGDISLPSYNFSRLFQNCTALKTAPSLPSTTLSISCYAHMFDECESLTEAPVLPATTLASSCYFKMFGGCSSLVTAPALPATNLDTQCYYGMFSACTSLTTAPSLPATALTNGCYKSMFANCTSLTSVPALPALTMANSAYTAMFSGCTSLVTVPALPATTLAVLCYSEMFSNCTSLTTAPSFFSESPMAGCFNYMFYMCTSLKNNIPSSIGNSSNSMPASACTYMFAYTAIGTMPDLPSLSVGDMAYGGMFSNCKSLSYAKDLPATFVGEAGYRNMFSECISITNGAQIGGNYVEIYATTANPYAFRNMFDGCSSLRGAKIHISHSSVGSAAMQYMFRNCTNIREIYTKLTDFPSRQSSPTQLNCKTYLWLENAGYGRAGNTTPAKLYVKDNVSSNFLPNNTYRYGSSYSSGFDVQQAIW